MVEMGMKHFVSAVLRLRNRQETLAVVGLILLAGTLAIATLHSAALSLRLPHGAGSAISAAQRTLAALICGAAFAVLAIAALAQRVLRRGHAARALSERQFSQLVRGITDYAICMLDPQGRVSQWNAGGRALIGY
jgi:PAS domain-containing protein